MTNSYVATVLHWLSACLKGMLFIPYCFQLHKLMHSLSGNTSLEEIKWKVANNQAHSQT